MGCFIDLSWYPTLPSLEGQDPRLDGSSYKLREKAIEKCSLVAKERGYKVFAVQDGGKCLSSSTAHKTIFFRSGRIRQCKGHGKGEHGINHVYVVGELKSMITFSFLLQY